VKCLRQSSPHAWGVLVGVGVCVGVAWGTGTAVLAAAASFAAALAASGGACVGVGTSSDKGCRGAVPDTPVRMRAPADVAVARARPKPTATKSKPKAIALLNLCSVIRLPDLVSIDNAFNSLSQSVPAYIKQDD
jgi:hypothetical protein